MATVSSHRILMAGLPSSGKTTFLAALWYLLTNTRDDEDGIRARNFGADRTYLNAICEQWMRCEQVERTHQADRPQSVEIPLIDKFGSELDLVVPDLSGELFRGLWEDRAWPLELARLLQESDGILFFIHPDHSFDSPLIEDANRQAALAGSAGASEDGPQEGSAKGSTETFDIAEVGDATQLVDILQCLDRMQSATVSRPLSVIISAWDRVAAEVSPTPEAFVERAAPLLSQYLLSHSDRVPVRYWGISAQGGHYPDEADRLADTDNPSDRIWVAASDTDVHNDLRVPLAWILEELALRR